MNWRRTASTGVGGTFGEANWKSSMHMYKHLVIITVELEIHVRTLRFRGVGPSYISVIDNSTLLWFSAFFGC